MWNKIYSGFEDETGCFGSRAAAETTCQVYEVLTCAVIESELNSQLNSAPDIFAKFHHDSTYDISIDKSLISFSKDLSEHRNIDLDHPIRNITKSEKYYFLLLNNGDILGLSKELDIKSVFHLKRSQIPELYELKPTEFRSINLFDNCGDEELIILTSSSIFRLYDLNYNVNKETSDYSENLEPSTFTFQYEIIKFPSYFTADSWLFNIKDSMYIFGTRRFTGGFISMCYMVNKNGNSMESQIQTEYYDEIGQIRKWIGIDYSPRLGFILINEINELVILCQYTLMVVKKIDMSKSVSKITSFQYVEGYVEPYIFMFGDCITCVKIPSFEIWYKLDVASQVIKMFPMHNQNYDDSIDGIVFLEFCLPEDKFKSIRLKIIQETDVEIRYNRLINKGKFEDAEKFAQAYNLDLEIIHKEMVKNKLNALHKLVNVEQGLTVESIIEILDKIKDVNFIAECCLKAMAPDTKFADKLLNYGKDRIISIKSKTPALEMLEINLGEAFMRLRTYELLCDMSSKDPESTYCSMSWLSFSIIDLFQQAHEHIAKGEMKEAALIWRRHYLQLNKKLGSNINIAIKMLKDIPDWLDVNKIVVWYQEFVPALILYQPEAFEQFIDLSLSRVKNLELSNRDAWPDEAIKFCNDISAIIDAVNLSEKNSILEFRLRNQIKMLHKFISILSSLSNLKHEFNIYLPFERLVFSNFTEVVLDLLDKCPIENINSLIDKFVRNKLLKQKNTMLKPDILLLNYVKEMSSQLADWCLNNNSIWEIRMSVILNSIYNTEEFLEGVYHLVRRVGIPWSQTINQLVDKALTFDHPMVLQIRSEQYFIPRKLIIKKYYGHGVVELKDSFYMRNLLKYIINSEKPEGLNDALEICKFGEIREDEVYTLFIYNNIVKGKWTSEDVSSTLEVLPKDLIQKIWHRIGLKLTTTNIRNSSNDPQKDIMHLFLPFKNQIVKNCHIAENIFNQWSLKNEFGVKTFNDPPLNPKKQMQNFDMSIQDLIEVKNENVLIDFEENNVSKLSNEDLFSKLERLSELFKMSDRVTILVYAKTLFKFWNPQKINTFLNYFFNSHLMKKNKDDIEDLFEALRPIALMLIQDNSNVKFQDVRYTRQSLFIIHEIVKFCLNETTNQYIISISQELSKWLRFFIEKSKPMKYSSNALGIPEITALYFNDYLCYADVLGHQVINETFKGYQIDYDQNAHQFLTSVYLENIPKLLKQLILLEDYCEVLKWFETFYFSLIGICFATKCLVSDTDNQKDMYSQLVLIVTDIEFWDCIMNLLYSELLPKLIFDGRKKLHCLALLDHQSQESVFNSFRTLSNRFSADTKHMQFISTVAIQYAGVHSNDDESMFYCRKYTSVAWVKLISSVLNIHLKDPFDGNSGAIEKLVKCIPDKITLSLFKDFCYDGKIDFQKYLLVYVRHLILSWNPDIEINEDSMGEKVLISKDDGSSLLNHLYDAVNVAIDPEELIQFCFNGIWPLINSYYYEAYTVVLDLQNHLNAIYAKSQPTTQKKKKTSGNVKLHCRQGNNMHLRNVFGFLKLYKRISLPSDSEEKIESYITLKYSQNNLSELPKFRLPFTGIMDEDPIPYIKPELNLKTYELWLKILPSIQNLEINNICFFAVYGSIYGGIKTVVSSSQNQWLLNHCNESLLKDIEDCVKLISNPEIVSALYYRIASTLPPGADQLKAINLCYQATEAWYKNNKSEEIRVKLTKVSDKFISVFTTNVLHKHNLALQQYIQLALNPEELITSLYDHPSIPNSTELGNQSHDINSAVLEICSIHENLDISLLIWKLVHEWIIQENSSECDATVVNVFFNRPINVRQGSQEIELSKNVSKASYALLIEDQDKAYCYLFRIANFGDCPFSGIEPDYAARYRAVQCLIKISDPLLIEDKLGHNVEYISKLVQNLRFLSLLSLIDYQVTLDSFSALNKEELVSYLIERSSPFNIKLSADLCLAYKIYKPKFWNEIIKFMYLNKMKDELNNVLPEITGYWSTFDSNSFIIAWNYLILSFVADASESTAYHAVKKCIEMIEKFPRPEILDLETFIQYCFNLKCGNLPELKILNRYL